MRFPQKHMIPRVYKLENNVIGRAYGLQALCLYIK
nr:MAG TPA: hypothetical protein [Caudoviricetes sp.]